MDLHSLEAALVGVAAFAFILYRQLHAQPVAGAAGGRRPVVFAAIGVVLTGQYVAHHHVGPLAVAGLALSLLLAAGLAYLRGHSVRLWRQDGAWWRRGTGLTLVLWFVSIGSHLGLDALVGLLDPAEGVGKGLGNATLLLYLAVSLGLQHLVVTHRVRTLPGTAEPVSRVAVPQDADRLAG